MTQPLEKHVQCHLEGTLNPLKHYGVMEGEPIKPVYQRYFDMEWGVKALESGVFHLIVDQGEALNEGQVIVRITDLDGSILAEVTSPITGIVHTMYPQRLVFPGDQLYTLLRLGQLTGC